MVGTNIHHPTDSRLLGDGVGVLSRLLHRAKDLGGQGSKLSKTVFRSHTRSVRRLTQEIHRVARRKGEEADETLKGAHAQLIGMAEASEKQAARVRDVLKEQTDRSSKRLVARLEHFLRLMGQAIDLSPPFRPFRTAN